MEERSKGLEGSSTASRGKQGVLRRAGNETSMSFLMLESKVVASLLLSEGVSACRDREKMLCLLTLGSQTSSLSESCPSESHLASPKVGPLNRKTLGDPNSGPSN